MPLIKRSDKIVKLSKEEMDGNFDYILSNLAKTPTLINQSYSPVTRSSKNGVGGAPLDTDWVTLATITVPGGTMNYNGKIVIEQDWKFPASASQKQIRLDWGGQWLAGPYINTSTLQTAYLMYAIKNTNSLSAQTLLNSHTYGMSTENITSTVNTSVDVAIDIKCSWSAPVASEQLILRGYSVWYYPGNT